MASKPIRNLMVIGALLAIPLSALPIFSGTEPTVRVVPSKNMNGLDLHLMEQVEVTLMKAGIEARRVVLDQSGVTVRLADAATRDSALGALKRALGASATVTADSASMPDVIDPSRAI